MNVIRTDFNSFDCVSNLDDLISYQVTDNGMLIDVNIFSTYMSSNKYVPEEMSIGWLLAIKGGDLGQDLSMLHSYVSVVSERVYELVEFGRYGGQSVYVFRKFKDYDKSQPTPITGLPYRYELVDRLYNWMQRNGLVKFAKIILQR